MYHAASGAGTAFLGVIVYHCHHTGTVLDYGVSIAPDCVIQSPQSNPTWTLVFNRMLCSQKFPSLEKRAKDTGKTQPCSLSPTRWLVQLFKSPPVWYDTVEKGMILLQIAHIWPSTLLCVCN